MNKLNDPHISHKLMGRLSEVCCHCSYLCLEGNSEGAEMKKRDYVAECTHSGHESKHESAV